MSLNDIKLNNSVHFDGLNETLISVSHICDTGKVVALSRLEAVVLNHTNCSVKEQDIAAISTGNPKSGSYELKNPVNTILQSFSPTKY